MDKSRRLSSSWAAVAAVLSAFFLAQQFGRQSYVFTHLLTARVVDPFASACKLTFQLVGSIFASRCAARYDKGSPVRLAWRLVSLWLGGFFLGQAGLAFYSLILRRSAPVPSVGDLFFLLGYACIIGAVVRFVTAYRASGLATGRIRDHALLIAAVCTLFVLFAYRELVPIALAPTPLVERLINVGYPVLDLVLLIPTLVLLRITMRFQGGRVWTVWAALLTGIVFGAGGDILYADVSSENMKAVGPAVDLLFILSYLAIAYGTVLQQELLAG